MKNNFTYKFNNNLIYEEIYKKIVSEFPPVPPEHGGILGSKNGIICTYFADWSQQANDKAVYVPNVKKLNRIIRIWQQQGISFCGIFHTHMYTEKELSGADREYIDCVFDVMPKEINRLLFPIVLPGIDLFMYCAYRGKGKIEICAENYQTVAKR